MTTKPAHHGDRCECNLCCWHKKHPQCQPRDDKGIDNRATQRILDDLGIRPEQASPATYRGMPAGDFDGLDPKGKTPRMGPDPLLAKIDRAWKTVNRIADDRDFGGVLGADGQVYSDADPGL